jgi:citronellol/citronellal dehydrogenase
MTGINTRGTYACTQACLPHLRKAENPHVLTLSPPPNLNPRWFKHHVAYTIAKYGMSLLVLGQAEEFKPFGIAVNALWPRTVIATAALQMIPGVDPACGRLPSIMADAAHAILTRDSRGCTGNFFIDEKVLAEEGVTDLTPYAVDPSKTLTLDLFLDP